MVGNELRYLAWVNYLLGLEHGSDVCVVNGPLLCTRTMYTETYVEWHFWCPVRAQTED